MQPMPAPYVQGPPVGSPYTRQGMLQIFGPPYGVVEEVDVAGHFHPRELLRKMSRQLTQMQYSIEEEHVDIVKTPVGQQTGEIRGVIRAESASELNPGGRMVYYDWSALAVLIAVILFAGVFLALNHVAWFVLSVVVVVVLAIFHEPLTRKEFVYRIKLTAMITVSLPGEVYEDFRRKERIPISSNVSVIIGGKVVVTRTTTLDQERRLTSGEGTAAYFPAYEHQWNFIQTKVRDNVRFLAESLESAREGSL